MMDLSETVEAQKKENTVLAAERDSLKLAERLCLDSQNKDEAVGMQTVNDFKQKLADRETVINNQMKTIQEFREKLRTKEVELRTNNERNRHVEAEWNKKVSEIMQSKQKVELEKENCEIEMKALTERLNQMKNVEKLSTDLSNPETKSELNEQLLLNELQLVKEKHDSECIKDKLRLERELKMLNETLYSTIAAKNKSIQECRLLQEQLQNERDKLKAQQENCSVVRQHYVADSSRQTQLTDEMNRMMSEMEQITSSREEDCARLQV